MRVNPILGTFLTISVWRVLAQIVKTGSNVSLLWRTFPENSKYFYSRSISETDKDKVVLLKSDQTFTRKQKQLN